MTHPSNTTTTVAILGSDTLAEGILARLLQKEGYATRILEAHHMGVVGRLLDGVDVLLLAPGLRRALVEAMRSNPKTAHILALSFSAALKVALLDELSASASWRSLFEELVGHR